VSFKHFCIVTLYSIVLAIVANLMISKAVCNMYWPTTEEEKHNAKRQTHLLTEEGVQLPFGASLTYAF